MRDPRNWTFFESLHALGVYNIGIFSHQYFDDRGISSGFDEWDNFGKLERDWGGVDVAGPRIADRVIEKFDTLKGSAARFALWTHFFDPSRPVHVPSKRVMSRLASSMSASAVGDSVRFSSAIGGVIAAWYGPPRREARE